MSITAKQLRKDFMHKFNSFNTQEEAAEYFGVTRQYLYAVGKGDAVPGPKILNKMGYKVAVRTIIYRYERL